MLLMCISDWNNFTEDEGPIKPHEMYSVCVRHLKILEKAIILSAV